MTYETQTPFVLNLHKASVQSQEAPPVWKSTMTTIYFRRWAGGLKVEIHGQCSWSAWRTALLVVIIVLMFRLFFHLSLKCLYFSHAAWKTRNQWLNKSKEVNSSRIQTSSKNTPRLWNTATLSWVCSVGLATGDICQFTLCTASWRFEVSSCTMAL